MPRITELEDYEYGELARDFLGIIESKYLDFLDMIHQYKDLVLDSQEGAVLKYRVAKLLAEQWANKTID